MVLKRVFSCEEKNDNSQPQATPQRNQRLKFTKCLCKDKLWLQAYSAQLENSIRKVVREEVEKALQYSCHSISRLVPNQAKPCDSRKFKLNFEGRLPQKLFTGNKVQAEGPSPIRVFLLDAVSGLRVTDGPLSSVKVRIVVLHGHFKAEELESWTADEFDKNVVFERDGKRPLLVGQHMVIALKNGIGSIGDITFTDNSSWERSKMFRFGAKVEAKENQVREAVSSPFEVKDRRGENYQKHKVPSPEDEVWRLRWIAKDGKICKRLAEHQIYIVKDFVRQYYLDESLLRKILKVSPNKWEAIIRHATSCFSGNTSQSPSGSEPIPGLNLQQFCVSPAYQDQQEYQIPHYHTEEHNHHLDESMALNNPFLMDFLAECGEERILPSLEDCMLPSVPMISESSSWFPIRHSMGEEGNGFFMESSHNSDIGMPSIPNMSGNVSETAKPAEGWEKVRAVWRILVKHGEAATNKGKFPCYSQ